MKGNLFQLSRLLYWAQDSFILYIFQKSRVFTCVRKGPESLSVAGPGDITDRETTKELWEEARYVVLETLA